MGKLDERWSEGEGVGVRGMGYARWRIGEGMEGVGARLKKEWKK